MAKKTGRRISGDPRKRFGAKLRPAVTGRASHMRFRCSTCGTEFAHEGTVEFADLTISVGSEEPTPIPLSGTTWKAPCPVCGREASATNQVVVESGGHQVVGFADTPDQVAAIWASIAELSRLTEDAGLDAILEVLEEQDTLRPVAEYLRANHLALASLGVGILGLVIAFLAYLAPATSHEQAPPVPPGITEDQMERLIDGFRDSYPPPTLGKDEGQKSEGDRDKLGQGVSPSTKSEDSNGDREH